VHATELGHRVVAVLAEDLLVELLGPLQPDGGVDTEVAADVEVPTNSSRNSRRSVLGEREYRANRAPLTTSGRLTRRTPAGRGW